MIGNIEGATAGVRSPRGRLNALAIVDYANGTRAYFFVPGHASPHLDLQLAHEGQACGDIPGGKISGRCALQVSANPQVTGECVQPGVAVRHATAPGKSNSLSD